MKLLVIPDSHAHPNYDNDRYEWLGRFICSVRPDVLLNLGDWGDIPSLCKHSKQIEKEGLRLGADRTAWHDSLDRLEAPIAEYNTKRAQAKKRRYVPRRLYLLGNHEARIAELANDIPQLEGELEEGLEPFYTHGWEVHPFKDIVDVGGFQCSHFLPSGVMGKPIGGVTQGRSLLLKGHQSAIVGHSHLYNHGSVTRWDGAKLHGLSAGCFVHPEYDEPWCRQTRPMWDLGVLLLDGVQDGDYRSKTWVTIEELQRRYG